MGSEIPDFPPSRPPTSLTLLCKRRFNLPTALNFILTGHLFSTALSYSFSRFTIVFLPFQLEFSKFLSPHNGDGADSDTLRNECCKNLKYKCPRTSLISRSPLFTHNNQPQALFSLQFSIVSC